ncbi:MAG: hypothetical protein WCJ35_27955 [Planctomycetota bacterium]
MGIGFLFRELLLGVALLATLALGSLASLARAGEAGDRPSDKEAQAKRRPDIYLTVFNNGYGGDPMPKEPEKFEKLLKTIASEGNFNAVMCRHSTDREAICKKYNVLMVVDLLADGHHVFKNPKECEQLCGQLRGNPTVVAYHLWSDRFGKTGPGRTRDINNVHQWDPTHATYSGTYQTEGMNYLAMSDFISYYDFSWKRGPHKNFSNLLTAWTVAKTHDNRIGRYVETDPGRPGEGNYLRSLYLQNTSIACGLKCCLWFIGSRIMDMNKLEFNELGRDAAKVNAWTKPLWAEIPRLGLPAAIYSTSITKDSNNRDVPAEAGKHKMPPGLETHEFPKEFWLQPVSGEFVMGVFKYDGASDAVYLANHNAYAEQDVKLKIAKTTHPRIFNPQSGKYEEVPVIDSTIRFKLEKAGGRLVLFP